MRRARGHAGAVILKNRLRHNRHRLAVPAGHVLDDVLVDQDLVGHACERRKSHIDFGLPRGADFVVVNLHPDSAFLQRAHHFRSEILQVIHGRDWEITLLVAWLVAEIWPVGLTCVPESFLGVDVVETVIVALVEAHIVQYVEFDFRTPIADIGDTGGFEKGFRLLRNKARIARVRLAGHWITHVTGETDGRHIGKRIEKGRFRIGDQQHVRLVDGLESADARSVEADTVFKNVFAELVGGDREMLPQSGHIAELKIDDLDLVVLCKFHNIAGSFDGHGYFLREGEQHRILSGVSLPPSGSGMASSNLSAAKVVPDNLAQLDINSIFPWSGSD